MVLTSVPADKTPPYFALELKLNTLRTLTEHAIWDIVSMIGLTDSFSAVQTANPGETIRYIVKVQSSEPNSQHYPSSANTSGSPCPTITHDFSPHRNAEVISSHNNINELVASMETLKATDIVFGGDHRRQHRMEIGAFVRGYKRVHHYQGDNSSTTGN